MHIRNYTIIRYVCVRMCPDLVQCGLICHLRCIQQQGYRAHSGVSVVQHGAPPYTKVIAAPAHQVVTELPWQQLTLHSHRVVHTLVGLVVRHNV